MSRGIGKIRVLECAGPPPCRDLAGSPASDRELRPCKRTRSEVTRADPSGRVKEIVVQAKHPPDESRPYLDALRELQQRESEIVRMVATIEQAAKCLEHWQAVDVVHGGAGFPKEVTMVGRSIDASHTADRPAARRHAGRVARNRRGRSDCVDSPPQADAIEHAAAAMNRAARSPASTRSGVRELPC